MTPAFRHRPLPIRVLNRLGGAALPLVVRHSEFDTRWLLEQAQARTGLDDFGPDDFLEPLERLLVSYNTEARLNFIGWLSVRTHLLQLLENRLRVEQDRKDHAEIAGQQIESPVFILGLPRTGSTLLFELMSRSPALRAPLTWEVMLPSPPPRTETFQTDPRIARTERLLAHVHRIAPGFQRIHAIGARLPQECLAILAQSFRSLEFHTTHRVPSYQAWLDAADLTPAYQYHHRLLQHWQAFGPRGTWLLKAPAHVFGIEALFRVYPDARVIQTHRDPLEVSGSISSHCATLRQAFSEHLDLEEIGTTWCRLWAAGLRKTMSFRHDHPELAGRFVDVEYRDLVRDPMDVVQRIHHRLGLSLSSDAEAMLTAHIQSHRRGQHGKHAYRLEDFGLSAEHVSEIFGVRPDRSLAPAG